MENMGELVNVKQEQEKRQIKKSDSRKNLERKLETIRKNIDSIVLFYTQAETYTRIRDMDKILKVLKKRIVSQRISMDSLMQVIKQYESIISSLWKMLEQIYPQLGIHSPANWRALNDSFQEKQMLCHRQNTFVYEPRSDLAGQALILLKNIGKAYIHYQNYPSEDSYQKLQQVSLIEQKLKGQLETLNEELKMKYNISF